mgnify:CR=1 FL=1
MLIELGRPICLYSLRCDCQLYRGPVGETLPGPGHLENPALPGRKAPSTKRQEGYRQAAERAQRHCARPRPRGEAQRRGPCYKEYQVRYFPFS